MSEKKEKNCSKCQNSLKSNPSVNKIIKKKKARHQGNFFFCYLFQNKHRHFLVLYFIVSFLFLNKLKKKLLIKCDVCRKKILSLKQSLLQYKMFKYSKISLALFLIILLNLISSSNATHLTGTFRPNEFFKLLIKFGFQKTEPHSPRDSFGYIYGNITSRSNYPVPITLTVLDKYNFLPYYGNRTYYNKDRACERMFQNIDEFAFDKKCHNSNTIDFLRRIPCKKGELCVDEDAPNNVVHNNQFTYVIKDLNQPRYVFIFFVMCFIHMWPRRSVCEKH